MPRLALAFAVCFSLACFGQEPSRIDGKRIYIRTYGFSILPPAGWQVGMGEGGLPIFVNFPWSKMGAQLRLPAGGSIIGIVSWNGLTRRKGDGSLAGWAHLDAVIAAPGTMVSKRIEAPPATEISEAIMVSFDDETFGPDDQPQHEIRVYWEFRREKFAAHLSYVIGDPKATTYQAVLQQIVFSVRPIR
jgi:hypothetical protein